MGITRGELDTLSTLKETDWVSENGTGVLTVTMRGEMPKLMKDLESIKRSWDEAPVSHGSITFEIPHEHKL